MVIRFLGQLVVSSNHQLDFLEFGLSFSVPVTIDFVVHDDIFLTKDQQVGVRNRLCLSMTKVCMRITLTMKPSEARGAPFVDCKADKC